MTIVQVAFYMPDEISKGISTEDYMRIGGVIRHNKGSQKGQYYKLLEVVDINRDKKIGRGARALQFAFNNRTFIKGGYEIAKVIAAEIYKKSKGNEESDVIVKFNLALNVYLNAVSEGALTIKIIKELMACLSELKVHSEDEEISITVTLDEFEILLHGIFDYTKKLAAANSIKLTSLETAAPSQSENPVSILQRNLEAQKRIFERAS